MQEMFANLDFYVVIFLFFAAFVAGFVCNYAFEAAFIIQNSVVSCLTKCAFCSIIYLILCFLCRLLKFSDFFRYFNYKKIPETLANTD